MKRLLLVPALLFATNADARMTFFGFAEADDFYPTEVASDGTGQRFIKDKAGFDLVTLYGPKQPNASAYGVSYITAVKVLQPELSPREQLFEADHLMERVRRKLNKMPDAREFYDEGQWIRARNRGEAIRYAAWFRQSVYPFAEKVTVAASFLDGRTTLVLVIEFRNHSAVLARAKAMLDDEF